MIDVSDELFERCLRVLFKAPADRPSLALLVGLHEEPVSFRRALAVAFNAAYEHLSSCTINRHPDPSSGAAVLCAIVVEHTGSDLWAVRHPAHRTVLGCDGMWDVEPPFSSRDEKWLAAHGFDRSTALTLGHQHAQRLADEITTVQAVFARRDR